MTLQNKEKQELENLEDLYELSPMQHGMLFHSIYSPDSGVYFEQSLFTIKGELSLGAFEGAWQRVLNRHSILRTAFLWEDLEKPLQAVYRYVEVPLTTHDWSNLSPAERELQLQLWIKADRSRGFDLSEAPLMRLALLRFTDDEYKFIFSRHHLVLDRWSRALVLKEFFAAYHSLSEGKEPRLNVTRPYVDYIRWLAKQDRDTAERFWRNSLAGFTEPTSLEIGGRTDHVVQATEQYAEQRIQLSETTTAKLSDFARQHRLTLNTLVQGAWALLLSHYTGNDDIAFGVTIAGRPAGLTDVESMVGLFINTLPLRVRLPASQTVLSWLNALQVQLGELQQFDYSSLLDIQGWSDVRRGAPLFQSILLFENLPVSSNYRATNNNLEFRDDRGFGSTTGYPLTVFVNPGRKLTVRIVYDLARYSDDAVQNLLSHFQTLFENLPVAADTAISRLPLLTESQQRQILFDWNNTETNFEQPRNLVELFEQQAASTPDATAVRYEDQELTYAALNARSNQLAAHLRTLGVGPEILVAICLERSLEMVIGLLGILKAGGAYLPLDPGLPKERLSFMLQDARVGLVITMAALIKDLPAHQANVVTLDADQENIRGERTENLDIAVTNENLAYVIYTSGSTGRPKGVQVSHAALANFLLSMRERPGISPSDVLLSVTTLSFDIAGLEFYLPLIVGARLVVARRQDAVDGVTLSRLMSQHGATVMQATPVTWRLLIESGWKGNKKLRIFCGGEALSRDLANQLLERSAELWNLYGPTETTIWSSIKCVSSSVEEMTIGKPIANTQIYILDRQMRAVPVGVAGELHIGGKGVARGYLNRPDLTAEKFVPDPYREGQRLYKTGDMARYLADGDIKYLGRFDYQIKIRGFRIEPGEIEAVLRQHELVREAVVIAHEEAVGDPRLIAYVAPHGIEPDTVIAPAQHDNWPKLASDLRRYLQGRLPEYMVPVAYVELSSLPQTPNGKVDRQALPRPGTFGREAQEDFVAPRTATEEKLASIWREVLKLDRVGIDDNFFNLGGHSLLATQAVARIRKSLRIDLPIRALFEAPTIRQLSKKLHDITATASLMSTITPVSRNTPLPLSFAQQRLWFLNELEGDSAFYNVPWAVRLRGELNVEALKEALNTILKRHETLRTSFGLLADQPYQIISDSNNLAFSITDLSELPDVLVEEEAKRLSTIEARHRFDLRVGPLIRSRLLRLRSDDHILCVNSHHIVSDGWSIAIFLQELTELYESFVSGRRARLPELSIQYGDYAVWHRKWLKGSFLQQQLNYWKEQLRGIPALLELPKDRPRPAVQTFNGATKTHQLDPALTKALNDLSQQEGVTLFMTLLAAFQLLLSRYAAQDDIVVGSPIAGRNQEEIEPLIGFFVNTLVLRTDLSGNPSFRELLLRVKEVALGAYANQELPFEKLVDELQPERSLSHAPLFQVMFALQNAPRSEFKLSGLSVRRVRVATKTSKFDLTLFATEIAENLNLTIEYNTDLFEGPRIERMLEHLQTLLQDVVRRPEARIGEFEILTTAERNRLLVDWTQTGDEFPAKCIHELFEEQVERTPEEIAIVFETGQATYRELNARANQLASYLKTRGVGPEALIGVCVERSLEMVVALLGILKAGGAYVPLDPAYPAERLRFMLEDANGQLLLTQQRLLKLIPKGLAEVVCLDSDWSEISRESEANPAKIATPENLAYVIYTSGSTGKPKGVAIEHRSAAALLAWARGVFSQEELAGVLASTSICFDLSVFELFVPLSCGGKVILAVDVLQILNWASSNDVRLINTVPSAMVEILRMGGLPGSVQTVNLAGEPLPAILVEKIYEQPQVKRVFDLYGPSEDTTYSTYALRIPDGPTTIGRPISNTRVYILNSQLQPVPIGVPGDLYIGGAGLARGYLKRPEFTAQVFVPDPFSAEGGTRLYKTGDLARYLEDGNIEFLGRVDNQVKLRGFRIELGEIEEVIKKDPRVSEAIVVAREDEPGDRRLAAYVVPNRDSSESDLKQNFQAEQVSEWQAVWNETYNARSEDSTFNIVGWNNSYTGEPISAEEMREWVDCAVDRILALRPRRVLEIGCGTGLLMFRIAPHSLHYHGTDLSKRALEYVRRQLSGNEVRNVTLTEQAADDFAGIDAAAFDTVIVNSVVQYFPSIDYLVRVLEGATKCVMPGGTIFLGDLRSLPLLRTLHTSVQLHRAASSLPVGELKRRIQKRISQEKELVIDPAFFTVLRRHLPEITHIDIQLKRGRYHNELTKFRYDVALRVGGEPIRHIDQRWSDWRIDQVDLEATRELLTEKMPEILAIRRIPDARLISDFKALTLLESSAGLQTAGELREALQKADLERGVEPEDLWALGKDLSYAVELTRTGVAADATFDAILRKQSAQDAELVPEQDIEVDGAWSKYANDPLLAKAAQSLQPDLIRGLRKHLPEYMTPSEFIFLNALPLTPNGKIDRSALPSPDQSRPELEQPYVLPRTRVERELANIWAEVLRRERVGVNDNFFELGGHSLLATQVISRIREHFELELPLRSMFESPTVADLAKVLVGLDQKAQPASTESIRSRRRFRAKVEQLSAEEVDSLLSKVLSETDLKL
jgi:amino acid adenylation domain-containing protein